MFDITGSQEILNKAELKRIIIENDNVTLEYREGYAVGEAFVPTGVDHIMLKDIPGDANADPPVAAINDFTDFLTGYSTAEDKNAYAAGIITAKLAE